MDANKRRERASAEAAEWWLRFEAGELSLAHRQEFVDWLRESALHVAELLRIAEVHGVLERFQGWEAISADGWESSDSVVSISDAPPRAPRSELAEAAAEDSRHRRSTRRWLVASVAAAAIAGFGVWAALIARGQILETGRGERRGVTLADGSVIQIDPQSRLRVRLDEHARNIELERGRALFRVARDPNRPFVVHADVTLVRAVGTQFGVEQAREGVVVTVAEGKVAVLPQNAEAISYGAASGNSSTQPESSGRNGDTVERGSSPLHGRGDSQGAGTARGEVLLLAGQQVTVSKRGPANPVRRVDTDRELAWATGRLVFENESVRDVVEEFNRYNVVQLHVSDQQLAGRAVSGVFDASEPESFIGFIQSVVPVRVNRAGQDITISSAP